MQDEKVAIYTQFIREVESDLQKVKSEINKTASYIQSITNEYKEAANEVYKAFNYIVAEYEAIEKSILNIQNNTASTYRNIEELRKEIGKLVDRIESTNERLQKDYNSLLNNITSKITKETNAAISHMRDDIEEQTISMYKSIKKTMNTMFAITLTSALISVLSMFIAIFMSFKAYKSCQTLDIAYQTIQYYYDFITAGTQKTKRR
ncbi:MAG: hypothetical protein QXD60_01065 [Nanopusillaceae archaeon]